MLCNRSYNNRINHLHERALRIVHNGNVSSVRDSLKTDQLISIHHTNIRLLGIELYKTRNNISCHVRIELFEQRNILNNHWSQTDFTTGPVSIANNGMKSSRYLKPEIWNIQSDIRNSGYNEEFSKKIKCWTPKNRLCKLCLNYIHHIGCVSKPYFLNQSFRGALANRKSAYFGRGSHDLYFCIKT